jgi:F-type H+-transporting ATPase subunit b
MNQLLSQLGIDWRLLIAQLVNFAILFWVLRRFAVGPIMNILKQRQEQIERSENMVKQIEADRAAMAQAHEEVLAHARQESAEIIKQAQAAARESQDKILAEAQARADEMYEQTRSSLAEERAKLVGEVKRDVAGLVLAAVERSVGDVADDELNQRLTRQAVKLVQAEDPDNEYEAGRGARPKPAHPGGAAPQRKRHPVGVR